MIGKKFIYENVRIDDNRLTIYFDYQIITDQDTFDLTESLKIPTPLPDNPTSDRVLRALHLALGISYYKSFLPPIIDHAYRMDSIEAGFWNTVFRHGLGEFLYKNKLHPDKLAKFSAQSGSVVPDDSDNLDWQETALLGIGGGKDSIVAGELLKELGIKTTGFVLATGENRGQAQAVANTMEIGLLGVERRLDPQILEINKIEGALNGHIPVSLIFALVGCLLASADNSRYVIVANESSASIPQTKHAGSSVNHQWSKSLEFEKLFQDFVHDRISKNLDYTSLIRPLSSVSIAKIFANYPKYYEVFTSDNSLFKINQTERLHPRWSQDSPKSLSSFMLLSPWISDVNMYRIFGHNFLNDDKLSALFMELLGAGKNPVLDCVGTPEELKLSLSMLIEQGRFENTHLINIFKSSNLVVHDTAQKLQESLAISNEHSLPKKISGSLINILEGKLS